MIKLDNRMVAMKECWNCKHYLLGRVSRTKSGNPRIGKPRCKITKTQRFGNETCRKFKLKRSPNVYGYVGDRAEIPPSARIRYKGIYMSNKKRLMNHPFPKETIDEMRRQIADVEKHTTAEERVERKHWIVVTEDRMAAIWVYRTKEEMDKIVRETVPKVVAVYKSNPDTM